VTEKVCGNCGRAVKTGTRCSVCYEYRRQHGVERPKELEEKRRNFRSNDTGKCLNCKREILTKLELCRTCLMWKLRHNGEMRPIEREDRIRNPKTVVKRERACRKCAVRKGRGVFTPCRSCHVKQLWKDGRYASRKPCYRPRRWLPKHDQLLKKLAGVVPASEIARNLTDEFCLARTEEAVNIRARILNVSLIVCEGNTRDRVAYLLGITDRYMHRLIKAGFISGHRYSKAPSAHWYISDEQIEEFLRAHPYMVNKSKIRSKRFKSIVEGEFVKDPWFSIAHWARILNRTYSGLKWYIETKRLHTVPDIDFGELHYRPLKYIKRSEITRFLDSRSERTS
jgi:hypothetical protein